MSAELKARVLVVIPAYNEEKTIADVVLGLRRYAPWCDHALYPAFEGGWSARCLFIFCARHEEE